jgi:hypothetical protein
MISELACKNAESSWVPFRDNKTGEFDVSCMGSTRRACMLLRKWNERPSTGRSRRCVPKIEDWINKFERTQSAIADELLLQFTILHRRRYTGKAEECHETFS